MINDGIKIDIYTRLDSLKPSQQEEIWSNSIVSLKKKNWSCTTIIFPPRMAVEIWSFVTPKHNFWSLYPCDNVVS
jgi:hypothetical protein